MKRFAAFFEQKYSDVLRQRKVIKEALLGGANTVAKISDTTEFAENLVLWNVMGLLKWGVVEVVGHENHEVIYSLKEV